MHKSNYSLEVLVNGRPAQEYYKGGKPFIESRRGSEYTLRFRNNSWKRVMAIVSVDGIEVLKGKAASEADNGYIVDAFSSIEVKGYRIDDKNVAAFRFSDLTQGYNVVVGAEKVDKTTGEVMHDKSPKNSGVIGVRVIEEDTKDHDYAERYRKATHISSTASNNTTRARVFYPVLSANIGPSSSVPYYALNQTGCGVFVNQAVSASSFSFMSSEPAFSGCSFSSSSSSLGRTLVADYSDTSALIAPNFDTSTQWGTKLEDRIKEVSFKRSSNVTDIEVYYASRQSLEAYGIDFSHTKQVFSWPSAFEDKKQYCKVPPGYKL